MVTDKVEKLLKKHTNRIKTLQFAMNIPKLDIQYSYSSTTPAQRFHSASVGKLMTAVLILKAIEQGKLALNSTIYPLLEEGLLDQLFVCEGKDYQREVTVEQLLGHTSGINDYFEGRTFDGATFVNDIIQHPDTFWTPQDLIHYTRSRQRAVGRPGQKFLYSDTGYILLGLIIEAVYGTSFADALQTHIFEPSGMKDTCLCFYSNDFDPVRLAPMYVNQTDIHLFKSLSCDFSGGGLSTTTADLLLFLHHLQHFDLISESSVNTMAQFQYPFNKGMIYGMGMIQLRFEQFFFLLRGLPRLQGHLGVTGVHAWYDPVSRASFVMNVGNTKDMILSFKLLISIIQMVQRVQVKIVAT